MANPVGIWVYFVFFFFFSVSGKVLPVTPLLVSLISYVVSLCIEPSLRILLGLSGLG